jgi:peptidoglycan/LPS O-acetylase OafA/YrhL
LKKYPSIQAISLAAGAAERGVFVMIYRPHLDALRAFAVIGVLISHLWGVPVFGHLGVRLFFVLSGFLITDILLRMRENAAFPRDFRSAIRAFYARRTLRIWPAYYALLFSALILDIQNIRDVGIWHVLFGSNFLFSIRDDHVPWVTSPYWSLAIEEQFYLVWPAIVLLAKDSALPRLSAALVFVGFAYTAIVSADQYGLAAYYFPPASFDALGMGAYLAVALFRTGAFPKWMLPLGAIALVPSIVIAAGGYRFWFTETLTTLPMAAAIILSVRGYGGVWGVVMGWKPLICMGKISFGIYLYHSFVLAGIFEVSSTLPILAQKGAVVFFVGTALTILVATASWFLIEAPANRLKRFFPYPGGEQTKAVNSELVEKIAFR